MSFKDIPVSFQCCDSWLYGVVSLPERPSTRGVLIVVGGPQYRAGSHRQFVLLSRELASKGIPVMRFDLRGMGDSEGEQIPFTASGDDIRCALDKFIATVSALNEVVIWGLCDAATSAACYAPTDRRVCGLALLNPWIRTEGGVAKTYLRHYYTSRILQRDFWQKALSGKLNVFEAGRSLLRTIDKAMRNKTTAMLPVQSKDTQNHKPLPEQMRDGLTRFNGNILFVLSGNDFTAKEFSSHIESSSQWQRMLKSKKVEWQKLAGANHTFSHHTWRNQVAQWTYEWINTF